ncbi:MFS transporter [Luteimonas fraxinea]|uniref:MFS transporter n=1 Tax=Luteimonas fraxinea TaxID=2901869 RepID=A0ABS8UAB2_9GAMM|nr:MFS transporter [Luteimonas fraxinea]MCD9096129.1 MFS transporter [Luteimonas fraxinea]MCD9124718.1 MFS transporter [Luteimonas fraxinea]UHH10704.1 MFS transporter [Luteimonas fraxinea]
MTDPRSATRTSRAGVATVLFLGLAAGVQMSDRGLQSILSPAIRQTFGVGDAVMGALHGIAGILIASALAIPLARLADRHSRKRILLALIAAWTVLTLLGALAPNFALFFVGRAAAGITEFAMIPIVYSLIPDLVGERLRVGANLTFAALMAVGASAGFYLGGDLLQFMAEIDGPGVLADLAPWRRTMALLALAGLPLLLLGTLTLDPPRHALDTSTSATSASLAGFVRSHLRQVLLFVGAAGGVAIAVQAVVPLIAMALERRFVADLGTIGHTLGMLTLAGTMISLPIAWLVDRGLRGRLGLRARPALMGTATAIAAPCAALLAFAPSTSAALVLTGAFLLTTCVANALLPTMLQDLAPVALRARAFAGYSFLIAAFCALGPVLAGGISQFVLADDLLSAISLAAVPPMGLTLVCTGLWCLRPPAPSR